MKYKSQYRGRWWYFQTLADAKAFAQSVFDKTGIVVSIKEVKK